jgi:hypothetical protein
LLSVELPELIESSAAIINNCWGITQQSIAVIIPAIAPHGKRADLPSEVQHQISDRDGNSRDYTVTANNSSD